MPIRSTVCGAPFHKHDTFVTLNVYVLNIDFTVTIKYDKV